MRDGHSRVFHEPRFSPVEGLDSRQDATDFHCGKDSLDEWIRERAVRADAKDHARVYVVADLAWAPPRVVAYYALAAGSVLRDDVPKKPQRNAPDPLPVVLLARLAVDSRYQGMKLADRLVRDALARAVSVADAVGAVAVLVHALDAQAEAFWMHYAFVASPLKQRQLLLAMTAIREAMG